MSKCSGNRMTPTAQEAASLPVMGGLSNLLVPRPDLVFIPVTPQVAEAVETAVRETLIQSEEGSPRRGSVAGRSVLKARGVTLPGVSRMSTGGRRVRMIHAEFGCAENG